MCFFWCKNMAMRTYRAAAARGGAVAGNRMERATTVAISPLSTSSSSRSAAVRTSCALSSFPSSSTSTPSRRRAPTASVHARSLRVNVVAMSKQLTGVVVSTKMDKTAVVEVVRKVAHPKYKKTIRRSKKYLAHDEENECKEGYLVTVEPAGRKYVCVISPCS